MLTVTELVKNFPTFHGTLSFIIVTYEPPLVPILSHKRPVHTFPTYLRSILILPYNLRLVLSSGVFLRFSNQEYSMYAFLMSRMHVTCPAHIITLIIPGNRYR